MSATDETNPTAAAPGALSRRTLLRASVAAGAAGSVALLAACGTSTAPTPAPTAPTATTLPVSEPTITGGLEATVAPSTPPASAPAATPAPVASSDAPDRLAQVMALSTALVGGGSLDPKRGEQLLALVDADPARKRALDALLVAPPAMSAKTPAMRMPWDTPPDAPKDGTPSAVATPVGPDVAKDLLRFWYLGEFDGGAVEGRDTFWFSLSAWQATRYTAATSICKAFGSWAEAPTT